MMVSVFLRLLSSPPHWGLEQPREEHHVLWTHRGLHASESEGRRGWEVAHAQHSQAALRTQQPHAHICACSQHQLKVPDKVQKRLCLERQINENQM